MGCGLLAVSCSGVGREGLILSWLGNKQASLDGLQSCGCGLMTGTYWAVMRGWGSELSWGRLSTGWWLNWSHYAGPNSLLTLRFSHSPSPFKGSE